MQAAVAAGVNEPPAAVLFFGAVFAGGTSAAVGIPAAEAVARRVGLLHGIAGQLRQFLCGVEVVRRIGAFFGGDVVPGLCQEVAR